MRLLLKPNIVNRIEHCTIICGTFRRDDAVFRQLGIALDVVPVVGIVGIAGHDAGDLVADDGEGLALHIGEAVPSGLMPQGVLQGLCALGMIGEVAIAGSAFCEGLFDAHECENVS